MGNHNSGRRPQPTALRVLRGNPGKRKPSDQEPVPPADIAVVKPAGLSTGAGAIWDELAPICLAMRTLTSADVLAFSSLCELQSTMRQVAASKDGRELFRLEVEDPTDPESRMEIV